jgi:hypothetical protein
MGNKKSIKAYHDKNNNIYPINGVKINFSNKTSFTFKHDDGGESKNNNNIFFDPKCNNIILFYNENNKEALLKIMKDLEITSVNERSEVFLNTVAICYPVKVELLIKEKNKEHYESVGKKKILITDKNNCIYPNQCMLFGGFNKIVLY